MISEGSGEVVDNVTADPGYLWLWLIPTALFILLVIGVAIGLWCGRSV